MKPVHPILHPLTVSFIAWITMGVPGALSAQPAGPIPASPPVGDSIQPVSDSPPASAAGPSSLIPQEGLPDPLLVNLEGQDAEKGTLAARDLLSRLADENSPRRAEYHAYLRQSLELQRIAAGGPSLRTAERLIAALGYTAESGQPFPAEGMDLVLGLVGAGPESLHKPVREAIYSFARAEARSKVEPARGRIVAALGAMLLTDAPPPPGVREEVFDILWKLNGKELLRSLIGALPRNANGASPAMSPYLAELRRRTALNFSSPEEWLRWWEQHQGSSIELILESAHQHFRLRNAELWSRTFRRIEGFADPEAYLGSVTDAIELDPTPELQLAAVDALGRFCDWLRDTGFSREKGSAAPADDSGKAAFAARGLALLLKLLDVPPAATGSAGPAPGGRGGTESAPGSAVSPEVKRRALVALRGYSSYLATNHREETIVNEALLAKLAAAPVVSGEEVRADLLELVRTAGALKVPGSRPYLERVLEAEPPSGQVDAEICVETITALGKVMEREVGREAVELILKYYRAYRDGSKDVPEKARREIRKACMNALNLRIDDPVLRREVRQFYGEILSSSDDRPSRVPAIIGLGILARGGDRDAVADLAGILERRSQNENAETVAAIDALAYLPPREALEHLLPLLSAKDRPFADNLRRKVLSLLKGQGLETFSWALAEMERQAFRLDQPDLLGLAFELTEDSELVAFLSPDRAANPKELIQFWDAVLVRERALEVSGGETRASAAVALLADLLVKDGRIREIRPVAEEELSDARGRISRRVEALKVIGSEPKAQEATADALLAVIEPAGAAETRWRGLRWLMGVLQGLAPSSENARLVEGVLTVLADPRAGGRGQAVWKAMPPEVRSRYLKGLESLRDSLKSAGPAATGN